MPSSVNIKTFGFKIFLINNKMFLLMITWIMKVIMIPTKIPVIRLVDMVTKSVDRNIINCSEPILKTFFMFSGAANL